MKQITNLIPNEVKTADLVVVSHSGGKDSQATLIAIDKMVKDGEIQGKVIIVHSDLGAMEWEPMENWIIKNSMGYEFHVVESEMDFFEMCRKYKRLPSGMQQFCTDFLKVKPIGAFIHDYMYKHNLKTAINVTGMRAEESKRRAKKLLFELSKMTQPRKHSEHTIYEYMPIFKLTTEDVFEAIKNAGQEPHEIYSKGFSRLSCVFCVNGRIAEHKLAAKMRPELFKKVADLEKELGKTYRLKQVKGVKYNKYMTEYCG